MSQEPSVYRHVHHPTAPDEAPTCVLSEADNRLRRSTAEVDSEVGCRGDDASSPRTVHASCPNVLDFIEVSGW